MDWTVCVTGASSRANVLSGVLEQEQLFKTISPRVVVEAIECGVSL